MEISFDRKTVSNCLQQRFILPTYQRDYKWEIKQLSELMSDIQEEFFGSFSPKHGRSHVGSYPPYFIGTIITTTEAEGKRGVVDGQQRLTTLSLILIYFKRVSTACSEMKIAALDPMLHRDVYGQAQYNIELSPDREKLFSLLLADNESDPQLLQEKFDSIEDVTPGTKRAFDLFMKIGATLSEMMDAVAIPYFVDYLIERVYLFEIGVPTEHDGHKVFVTMNDRGLKLGPIDLLKGYLLSGIKDNIANQRANAAWTATMKKLNELGPEEDAAFFKSWLRAQFAVSTRGKSKGDAPQDFELIGDAYHRWVTNNIEVLEVVNADDYYNMVVTTVPRFADLYCLIKRSEATLDDHLAHVFYNGCRDITLQSMILLSAVSEQDTDSIIEKKIRVVSKFLDCYLTGRTMEGKDNTYDNIRDYAFNIAKKIRRGSLEAIQKILKGELASRNDVYAKFSDLSYFNVKRQDLLFILARIGSYLEDGIEQTNNVGFATYIDRKRANKTFDVEHIIPGTEGSAEQDFGGSPNFVRLFYLERNQIGGLILLPRGRNRSLKNMPLSDKYSRYASENVPAQSLTESFYENNPQIKAFVDTCEIEIFPIKAFDADIISKRTEIYKSIVKKIWHPDIIDSA